MVRHCVLSAHARTDSLFAVVRPLYATLARISPGMGGYCVMRVDANRAAWEAVANAKATATTPRHAP
jgi:hypothetical protein